VRHGRHVHRRIAHKGHIKQELLAEWDKALVILMLNNMLDT
jgi:hypothetical protein